MSNWNADFDKYVGHYSKYQVFTEANLDPEDSIRVIDSDIGRNVGFKRVAIHHIIVPPNCRTSSPHAESLEEEFVLVLKGQPHLWLNGYIHDLNTGFAVGFPAGTGIAHTFINNSNSDVHLLVVGEQTKKDNLCSFPIDPELKKTCGIWWENPPSHPMGPHNGRPGPIRDYERATNRPSCIVDCSAQPLEKPFNYPGNNELFGHGFRLTNKLGLKALGIWYESLPSGRRTAFPHAHTHEEEFIFVLKGNPSVWMDGFVKEIQSDHFAAFPSNTGIAHTLINNSNQEVLYLCIGETQDFPGEKISYPLHPLRHWECLRKGFYWTDLPDRKLGLQSGAPERPFQGHIQFKIVTNEYISEVLELLKAFPQYILSLEGKVTVREKTEYEFFESPLKRTEVHFKELLLIEMDGTNMGVLDLHVHDPIEKVCYISFFILPERLRMKGLGRRFYSLAEDYIKRALECDEIRLGISDSNDISGFWIKMGFIENGKKYSDQAQKKSSEVREFSKKI